MKETKEERFCRVAEARVNKIIKMIRLLGNCSNTMTYRFREEQIGKIFDTLQIELGQAKKRFEQPKKKRFSLSQSSQTSVMEAPCIEQILPDGSKLRAVAYHSDSFPAINIYLVNTASEEQELVCFAEFNPEHTPEHELHVGAYQSHLDETTYYQPYMAERENDEQI